MSVLYKRIEELCREEGKTITTMCRESGASRASLSDLKMGRKQSLSAETLSKIAGYFNVSVDYLLNGGQGSSVTAYTNGICAYLGKTSREIDSKIEEKEPGTFKIVFRGPGVAITVDNDGGATEEQISSVIAIYSQETPWSQKTPILAEKDERPGTISQFLRGWDDGLSGIFPDNVFPLPGMREWKVLGGTACGDPLYMDLDGETILAPDNIDADFVFRCVGDSMIGARILDGDIVFVKSCNVDNGQIAVVRIGEEYTLKRIYRGEDYLELRAENPAYPPKIIRGDQENAEIIGRAVHFLSRVI